MPSRVTEYGANALHQLFEALLRFFQLLPAHCSQLVIFGLAAGFSERPLRANPSALFHAVQSGVQRSLFYIQQFIGCSLNMEHDAIAVQRTNLRQRLEDQKVQTSLKVVPGHDLPLHISVSCSEYA